ncbi:MAG TPA: LamG-like jellyroll fold domain-containing protein, partial [bacterium]|nr:LamG-like jellyroll fold domain-containing protein [bacterium]
GSLLSLFQYAVYSSTGKAGTLLKDWATSASNISDSEYSDDWMLDFYDLASGTANYVSVRVYDNAGNMQEFQDVFHVWKDTGPPAITDSQAGDDTYRTSNNASYNVDFDAVTLSKLDKFETRVYPGPGQAGQILDDWRTVASGIDAFTYTQNWKLKDETWALIPDGVSYVTVRLTDLAGNTSSWADIFYVKRESQPPSFGTFSSKNNSGQWIGSSQWNDDASPDVRIQVQDTESGLRIGKTELASTSDTGLLIHLAGDITDSSVFGHSGTLYGQTGFSSIATWKSAGGNENMLTFDGTNDWLEFNDHAAFDGMTAFTIETWVRDTANDVNPRAIVSKRTGASSEYCYALFMYTGRNVYFDIAGSGDRDNSSFTLAANEWHHIAVTFDGNAPADERKKIYYDGELDSAHNSPYTSIPGENSKLRIGILNADYGNSWQGQIDEVRISSRALSAEEIAADYNSACVKYTTDGGSSWTIDPAVTRTKTSGSDGTAEIQISTAAALPLKESATQSRVKFLASDRAGYYAESSVYTVKIDTTAPAQTGLVLPADNSYADYSPVLFDWSDVTDSGSGLDSYQIQAATSAEFVPVTVSSPAAASSLSVNLGEKKYWWRARAQDASGNYGLYSSTRSFRVDISTPAIDDNQDGDDNWRAASGTEYDVDFADQGDSLLKNIQYTAWTGAGLTGEERKPWSDITEISSSSYTLNWQVDFNSLKGGKNYISVSCEDNAGNSSSKIDAFYVLKDTAAPVLSDLQDGDTIWRNTNSGLYSIDYADSGGSKLDYARYKIISGTGGVIVDWYTYASSINSDSYSDPLQLLPFHFSLLTSSYSYVSVRCYDVSGQSDSETNAFYVKKDTVAPDAITDLAADSGTEGKIVLNWTVTGDDDQTDFIEEGAYEIRYTQDVLDSWDTADYSLFIATQTPAGNRENRIISGLVSSATYYLWIKVRDKAGSWSDLSNSTRTLAGPDITAPAQITDLAASPGDYQGQVNLSWTAPGDNNGTGTVSGYIVKYQTYPAFSWSTATEYVQSWPLLSAGSIEEKTLTDFDHTKTYWFGIKARDEVPNYSVTSNTSTSIPGQPGARDGMVLYAKDGSANPFYKNYTGGSFGAETDIAGTFSGSPRWIIARNCPVFRDERIAGMVNFDQTTNTHILYVMRWNGSNWSEEWNVNVSTSGYQAFDIAYEASTGDCLVVYGRPQTSDELGYRIWNGSSWTDESIKDTSASNYINWLRAVPQPGADDIMVILLDAGNNVVSNLWSGTNFVLERINTTGGAVVNTQAMDGAWETNSGKHLVAWSEAGNLLKYDIYYSTSSSWDENGPFTMAGISAERYQWVRLERDPDSDRIGFGTLGGGNDVNVNIWDNGWGTLPGEDATTEVWTGRHFDIGWSKDSGKFFIAGAFDANALYFSYTTWTAAGG